MKRYLVLVEGPTDEITLENPLRTLFEEEEVTLYFYVLHGDITSKGKGKRNIKGDVTLSYLKKAVHSFLKMKKLKASDLTGVIEITDLDGCFAQRESYVYSSRVKRQEYQPEKNRVLLEAPESLYYQRRTKRQNLLKMVRYEVLFFGKTNLPYYLYYFSINLEHALYNESNCKTDKKKDLSEIFEEQYTGDKLGLIELFTYLKEPYTSYEESWDEVILDNNPFKRASNLYFFFDVLS